MIPSLSVQRQGQSVVSADQYNTYTQGGAVVSDLRAFPGLDRMTVTIVGFTTPNDGGFGTFYWNSSALNPVDDNGATTIVPFGTDQGCWTRLIASVNAPYITVKTIAELKALPIAVLGSDTPIFVEGYHAANDGGGGVFLSTTVNPGADNGGTIIWSNTSGWYFNRWRGDGAELNLLWFGADRTGAVSSTTAIDNWLAVGFAPGSVEVMYAPGGSYIDGGRVIDVTNRLGSGFIMHGDGADTTRFNLFGGGWQFVCLGGGGGFFYPQVSDMDLSCDAYGGPALEIGSRNLSDAANGLKLENMRITNAANSNSANCALRLNVCVTFQFINVTTNCGSTSWTSDTQVASLLLFNAGIGVLQGSFSSAGVGCHMAIDGGVPSSGFNYALTFQGIDFEVNWYDVQCTSPNSANNTFIGGTYVWTPGGAPFNFTDGISQRVINGNISNTLVFGSGGSGYVGLSIEDYRLSVSTPAFPATTVFVKNTSGFNVTILFASGIITQYQIKDRNGGVVTLTSAAVATGIVTIPLDTECEIAVTYDVGAGQPGWVWYQR